ncbi:hypothetical protein ES708_22177 [subsurface metagenome]
MRTNPKAPPLNARQYTESSLGFPPNDCGGKFDNAKVKTSSVVSSMILVGSET